jgi:hypothetical protein
MNQLQTIEIDDFARSIAEIEQTQKMCAALMQTKHYAKLNEVGIFTVVQKARSMGMNVLDALNGGMYFVNGKVELSANSMNYLIRSKGHSVTKDPKSTKDCCVLQGKRADNGDHWIVSFSIEDAKKAGIYKNVWLTYPEDMLFARALSRLARQLFPDVIKGCYVEGELTQSFTPETKDYKALDIIASNEVEPSKEVFISEDQAFELCDKLVLCSSEYQKEIKKYFQKIGVKDTLVDLPITLFERVSKAMDKNISECKAALHEESQENQIATA